MLDQTSMFIRHRAEILQIHRCRSPGVSDNRIGNDQLVSKNETCLKRCAAVNYLKPPSRLQTSITGSSNICTDKASLTYYTCLSSANLNKKYIWCICAGVHAPKVVTLKDCRRTTASFHRAGWVSHSPSFNDDDFILLGILFTCFCFHVITICSFYGQAYR